MSLLQRARQALSAASPTIGIDIAPDRVSAVALSRHQAQTKLLGHATELLPEHAITSTASEPNIVDRKSVVQALSRVLKRLPRRPTRVALTVPDSVAKVSFVHFDTIPGRAADLDRLVAWQVRKAAPFRLEDAQLAHTPGTRHGEQGREYVVVLVRRDIVREYESVCTEAGAHAGLVDLASMNLINTALMMTPAPSADWLLVHSTQTSSTLAIIRGRDLIFFRNRPATTEGDFAELVHQSAMYYQDRLNGGGLKRAVFVDGRGAAVGSPVDAIGEALEYRLAMPIERLGSDGTATTLGVGREVFDSIAAPIGLLLREHTRAA